MGPSGSGTDATGVDPAASDRQRIALDAGAETDAGRAPKRRRFFAATFPLGTVIAYLFLIALLLITSRASLVSSFPYINEVLSGLFLLFLFRTISTTYILDRDRFTAWRIFGARRVRYRDVRRIEYANLRDMSPVSFVGSWGWRGRMWSPSAGYFDSVYTVSRGLLVTARGVPVFVSPRDPDAFARELSRRVRSYTGPLAVDVGAPTPAR